MRGPLVACYLCALGLCASAGCKSGGGDYLGAGVTAGLAVAAAGVYRGATDGCWAACANGEECDEESGMCVPAPCRAACPADHRCMWVEGQQQCVAPSMEGVGQLEEVEGARKTDKQPNQALCLLAGITDCADKPHRPLAPIEEPSEADVEVDLLTGATP